MASRGQGRRGRPRGASQALPIFYQQAFAEAIGVVATAIAQASATGRQGGQSNLQRFKSHHMATHLTKDPPSDDSKQQWMEEDACLNLNIRNSIDSEVINLINHREFFKN